MFVRKNPINFSSSFVKWGSSLHRKRTWYKMKASKLACVWKDKVWFLDGLGLFFRRFMAMNKCCFTTLTGAYLWYGCVIPWKHSNHEVNNKVINSFSARLFTLFQSQNQLHQRSQPKLCIWFKYLWMQHREKLNINFHVKQYKKYWCVYIVSELATKEGFQCNWYHILVLHWARTITWVLEATF